MAVGVQLCLARAFPQLNALSWQHKMDIFANAVPWTGRGTPEPLHTVQGPIIILTAYANAYPDQLTDAPPAAGAAGLIGSTNSIGAAAPAVRSPLWIMTAKAVTACADLPPTTGRPRLPHHHRGCCGASLPTCAEQRPCDHAGTESVRGAIPTPAHRVSCRHGADRPTRVTTLRSGMTFESMIN